MNLNREERRNLEKQGVSKENIDKLKLYNQPCTILEVVKLARAIAEDVANESLEDYRRRSTSTIVALTLQLEILKDIIIKNELASEEDIQARYETAAKDFEEKQREYLNAMREREAEYLQDKENADTFEETPKKVIAMSSPEDAELEVEVERK